jgi:tetratricopeptide (TPR) repeat protein
MHFRLGTAYFALEQWKSAETEFEISANMNTKDDASAYNLALSLARQGMNMDAARWLENVLRRNPNRQDRADILKMIEGLRQ